MGVSDYCLFVMTPINIKIYIGINKFIKKERIYSFFLFIGIYDFMTKIRKPVISSPSVSYHVL